VNQEVSKKVKVIVDGGECRFGIGSTIVDLTNQPKIIREGAGLEKARELLKLFKF
ncbi:Sua5/YciO/YrdC/YwlC family protein, partial [Candidatus Micrarchaeota archaeon]|nr:Sua5/YciO/YrdC/YwlC family protein [Candidatus Micrarchaeota archaeon]